MSSKIYGRSVARYSLYEMLQMNFKSSRVCNLTPLEIGRSWAWECSYCWPSKKMILSPSRGENPSVHADRSLTCCGTMMI